MPDSSAPCVLVIADPDRIVELVGALSEPLPTAMVSKIELYASSGGDEAVDLFEAHRPQVVVVTASLETGDTAALVDAVRGMVPRGEVGVVVIGDPEGGAIRNAIDAAELAPDRFVSRPMAPRTLRFAVASALEAAIHARAGRPPLPPLPAPPAQPAAPSDAAGSPGVPAEGTREALRRRWEALADSMADSDDDLDEDGESLDEAAPLPPPIVPRPHRTPSEDGAVAPPQAWRPGTTSELPEARWSDASAEPPPREPTLIIRDPSEIELPPPPTPPPTADGGAADLGAVLRAEQGDRWSDAMPLAVLLERDLARDDGAAPGTAGGPGRDAPPDRDATREEGGEAARSPGAGDRAVRFGAGVEIGHEVHLESGRATGAGTDGDATSIRDREPGSARATGPIREVAAGPVREAGTGPGHEAHVDAAGLGGGAAGRGLLADAALAATPGRIGRADAGPRVAGGGPDLDAELVRPPIRRDLPLPYDGFGDDLVVGGSSHPEPRLEVLDDLPDATPPAPSSADGRDFARQLRAKMSQMAQRLFQGADAPAPAPADLAPRHDHSTEIDLSALGDELPLAAVTEIEARASARAVTHPELATSPGSWDSQVRERGLPDQGEIVRGVSDAPMLLAKMFAGGSTGRILFRRGEVEIVVFFDQGRPVFASSSEARDRMGELLVREGKITASQYERCQSVVAESGRRMGEILVDFGYLKRRELLPAVRRHVEDIVYALFGWDSGRYHISIEAQPSAERIRLSRHPAALILEGIRRKLNRTTLERLIGPTSTVIEVGDRDRLGGIINVGDLSSEERAALGAFDGHTDLAQVARIAGVDAADVLPLAWGLCVLGLASARRTDTELPDEGTALIGETDLAIDRERVRARWELVSEADYFALLGVRRDATGFEIRRAYQAARRDFAADGFPPDLRRELARELDDIANVLDEAFHVLRDDRLRQTYLANLVE